ncbi:MAG: gamma-glutamyltransferase [Chloroflexota bacterium]|nr:gamma-glutamyltransferase [Chloroflexota bacterium]
MQAYIDALEANAARLTRRIRELTARIEELSAPPRPLTEPDRRAEDHAAHGLPYRTVAGQMPALEARLGISFMLILLEGRFTTRQDLEICHTRFLPPVTGTYRDYAIATSGPPGMGQSQIQSLNTLECLDLTSLEWRSAPYFSLLARVFQTIYADRPRFNGDPLYQDVSLEPFLRTPGAGDQTPGRHGGPRRPRRGAILRVVRPVPDQGRRRRRRPAPGRASGPRGVRDVGSIRPQSGAPSSATTEAGSGSKHIYRNLVKRRVKPDRATPEAGAWR